MADWRRAGQVICRLFAAGWFLTGLVYGYAGIVAPVTFDPAVPGDPGRLADFFAGLRRGAPIYVIAFCLFAAADFLLILLASVLRRLIGQEDFRGEIVRLCIAVAMFLGVLVDLVLLSHWLVIAKFSAALPPGLWALTLDIQWLGIWLSVAGFVLGAIGLAILAQAMAPRPGWQGWARMTRAFAGIILLEVLAIVFDTATDSSGLLTGVFFLLLTGLVAPAWALWLARRLPALAA